MKYLILSLLALLALLVPTNLRAEDGRFNLGLSIEGLADPYTFIHGLSVGGQVSEYFDESNFRFGVAMQIGAVAGTRLETDNVSYGGLLLGYDSVFKQLFHYEANVLVGYGFGSYGKSLVLQPDVGIGVVMVQGWRAVFTVGYRYMPTIAPASGFVYGIRIERKTTEYGNGSSH